MDGLTLLGLPAALVLYGVALALCLFDRFRAASRGIFTYLGCALALLGSAYALIMGASLWECAAVLTVFLIIELGVKK